MRVLAIDPGERVGWAHGDVYVPPKGGLRGQMVGNDGSPDLRVTGHGISFLKDFALKLHEVASTYDVIVYETWRLRADKARAFIGNDFQSSQLIGMVRMCAWLNPRVTLISQGPGVKSTADRSMPEWLRAKIAALPAAHDDSHDGDALRHLWHYFWERYV